jgi:hypothetical protein
MLTEIWIVEKDSPFVKLFANATGGRAALESGVVLATYRHLRDMLEAV